MLILIEIATNPTYTKSLQISLVAIILGGFLLATIVGSIGWYILSALLVGKMQRLQTGFYNLLKILINRSHWIMITEIVR